MNHYFAQKSNTVASLKSSSNTTSYHKSLVQTKAYFESLVSQLQLKRHVVKLDDTIEISHSNKDMVRFTQMYWLFNGLDCQGFHVHVFLTDHCVLDGGNTDILPFTYYRFIKIYSNNISVYIKDKQLKVL